MKTLPLEWTDRHTRIARFALLMMAREAHKRAVVVAQNCPPSAGMETMDQFLTDGEDALVAREMLGRILPPKKDKT